MEKGIKIEYENGYVEIGESKSQDGDDCVAVIKNDGLAGRKFTMSKESFVKIISQLLVDSVDESIKVSDMGAKKGTFHSTIVRREALVSALIKNESFEDFVERCNTIASSLLSQGYAVNTPEYIDENTAVINYWVEWRA